MCPNMNATKPKPRPKRRDELTERQKDLLLAWSNGELLFDSFVDYIYIWLNTGFLFIVPLYRSIFCHELITTFDLLQSR